MRNHESLWEKWPKWGIEAAVIGRRVMSVQQEMKTDFCKSFLKFYFQILFKGSFSPCSFAIDYYNFEIMLMS